MIATYLGYAIVIFFFGNAVVQAFLAIAYYEKRRLGSMLVSLALAWAIAYFGGL